LPHAAAALGDVALVELMARFSAENHIRNDKESRRRPLKRFECEGRYGVFDWKKRTDCR
jgi:hypothetical protein